MIDLTSLSVKIGNADIAPLVINASFLESIKGGIRGSLTIQDNINFYDTTIGAMLQTVEVDFEYLGVTCKNVFVYDGVTDMEITRKGKKYELHFISVQSVDFKTSVINQTYSSNSEAIIFKIFREACNEDSKLLIDTSAITKGRYIVPNIVAGAAIKNVLDTAFDITGSQLCLYQRLWDQGATRLTSYSDMNRLEFKTNEGKIYLIKNAAVGLSEDGTTDSVLSTVGTSSQFTLMEANKDASGKQAAGYYGHQVTHIELDETNEIDFKPAETRTELNKTKFPLSKDLYDDGVVSLFKTAADPMARAAMNQRKRLYNHFMRVSNVVAVPYIGCGMSIAINPGSGDVSNSRETSKKYIIQNIQHSLVMNDGEWAYSQNLGLIRE